MLATSLKQTVLVCSQNPLNSSSSSVPHLDVATIISSTHRCLGNVGHAPFGQAHQLKAPGIHGIHGIHMLEKLSTSTPKNAATVGQLPWIWHNTHVLLNSLPHTFAPVCVMMIWCQKISKHVMIHSMTPWPMVSDRHLHKYQKLSLVVIPSYDIKSIYIMYIFINIICVYYICIL